jgi:hypothetical protein
MSKNCIRCVRNERTGLDLLCDACRAEEAPRPQSGGSARTVAERTLSDALAIYAALEELRANEGASLTINCSNPEGTGPDNEAVEVADDWTNWQPLRFYGSTLRLALGSAMHEKQLNSRRRETV